MLKSIFKNDYIPEIGIDEAGRGPLWGPMMAAAVLLPPEDYWTEAYRGVFSKIKDSKKLTAKKRSQLANEIKSIAISYGIGSVSPQEIDMRGATYGNQMAFRRAVSEAKKTITVDKLRLLVDGILPLASLEENEECETIIEGDAQYLQIAAASILAKEAHDEWVINWCKDHVAEAAKYDLLSCKGYGTAKHREGILKHGYTNLHRRLYLRKLIPDIVVSRYGFIEDD